MYSPAKNTIFVKTLRSGRGKGYFRVVGNMCYPTTLKKIKIRLAKYSWALSLMNKLNNKLFLLNTYK